eukprot:TRINITY_DN3022_c0_g1_i1.p1 TRINITY_DN3022_c0_g1~~TRINITY_DN3022_c0_g1_i1.p1  ORF type:complete len:659 (-),score=28.61 TRINITY_DN3022_c0_g1_i1:136-1842(-)
MAHSKAIQPGGHSGYPQYYDASYGGHMGYANPGQYYSHSPHYSSPMRPSRPAWPPRDPSPVVAGHPGAGYEHAPIPPTQYAHYGRGGHPPPSRYGHAIHDPGLDDHLPVPRPTGRDPEARRNPERGRFFVIKSFTKGDILKSMRESVWASTKNGNANMERAWAESGMDGIYLFFSVNGSGEFCGCARMATPVRMTHNVEWSVNDRWKGNFSVRWLFIVDVPNSAFKSLYNCEQMPVTRSRDTDEVPFAVGCTMMSIFRQADAAGCYIPTDYPDMGRGGGYGMGPQHYHPGVTRGGYAVGPYGGPPAPYPATTAAAARGAPAREPWPGAARPVATPWGKGQPGRGAVPYGTAHAPYAPAGVPASVGAPPARGYAVLPAGKGFPGRGDAVPPPRAPASRGDGASAACGAGGRLSQPAASKARTARPLRPSRGSPRSTMWKRMRPSTGGRHGAWPPRTTRSNRRRRRLRHHRPPRRGCCRRTRPPPMPRRAPRHRPPILPPAPRPLMRMPPPRRRSPMALRERRPLRRLSGQFRRVPPLGQRSLRRGPLRPSRPLTPACACSDPKAVGLCV